MNMYVIRHKTAMAIYQLVEVLDLIHKLISSNSRYPVRLPPTSIKMR